MENNEAIRTCANCLHCGIGENNKPQCRISYEMYTGKCKAFASQNVEIVERYAKEIVRDSISTPLAYIGLAILVLAILVCFLAGYEILGDYALLALIATGIVCLTLAAVFRYIYRLNRKDMRRQVCNEVEQELRKELSPKYLRKEAIKEYLTKYHYMPEVTGDANVLLFTFHEIVYTIYYDGCGKAAIGCLHTLNKEGASLMGALLKHPDSKIFSTNMWIQEYSNDDGENSYALRCVAEFFIEYIEDFERVFVKYLSSVEFAVNNIFNALNQCVNDEQTVMADMREDIYGPEYVWLPGLVSDVSKGQVSTEVLTDETWIRNNIQSRCNDEIIRGEWDSFKIKRVDNYGDYKMIVYQFPEPKVVSEAKYGIALLNKQSLSVNYYTLEMSYDDTWFYGGVTDGRHLNYGPAESADLDKFIEWIFSSNKQVLTSTNYTN